MVASSIIPLVDISALSSACRDDRLAVAAELDRAAAGSGFLAICGDQFDPALLRRLLARAEAYFALDQETKMASYIGLSENHSGYVPVGEEQFGSGPCDLKEAFDVNIDYRLEGGRRPLLGPNLWPKMDGFREDVTAYYQHLTAIGRLLFRGFALALGLDEAHFEAHMRQPPSQLRLIHYPFDPDAEDRPGIGAHTDYECFTLLAATAPGLQLLDGTGTWIDVPMIPDALVLNIGDMMEVMSNGRYLATTHRVRKVKEERYAFPLFFACDYDHMIAPLVPDEAPRYAPLRGGDHLFNETARTFAYLKRRIAAGEVTLPDAGPERTYGLQTATARA